MRAAALHESSCHLRYLCCRWDEEMDVPSGAKFSEVGIGQWSPGISFGDFSERTIQKYHPAQPSAKHVAEVV